MNFLDLWGLSPSDANNSQTSTTVKIEGGGIGVNVSAIVGGAGMQIDKSWTTVTFTLVETGESFTEDFTTTSLQGEGLKVSTGVNIITVEGSMTFEGTPTQEEIIIAYGGLSTSLGVSTGLGVISFGLTGTETANGVINTTVISVGVGIPVSFGFQESNTESR